jgi:tetratricopeptide (TPR) repeat protein
MSVSVTGPWTALRRRPGRALAAAALLLVLGAAGYAEARQLWAQYHDSAARAALDRRELDRARAHLDACLRVWPRDPELALLQARLARQADLYAEAERRLDDCRRLKAAPEAVALEQAMLRAQQGDLTPDLEASLRACVDQGRGDPVLILEALSRGYSHTYRLPQALSCLDQWLRRRPDDVQALLGRGWVHERLHRYEKARDDYRRAAALDPGREEPALRLAQVLLLLGESPEEAAAIFERLRRRPSGNPASAVGLAQCCARMGRTEEAEQLLERLAAEHPQDAQVLLERGNLALQRGEATEAEPWLRRAAALAPSDYQVNYALFQCLHSRGEEAEAGALRARVRQMEADLLRMDALTEELQRRPYDAALRCEIGQLFLRNGEPREGELWLKGALQVDPGHRPAHQALARYYEGRGEPDLAARHRRLAEEGEPPSP